MDDSESKKFDAAIRKMFTVSPSEIRRRDEEWHRKRAQKKRKSRPKANNDNKNKPLH
jgi:hypothetical protein